MNIPESMKAELGAWNNGEGVDIETWIACTGNFSLAVGYASIFCPEFKEFEGYLFRFEGCEFSEEDISSVRNWEAQEGITPKSIECVLNHIHISDLQYSGCDDLTIDKVLVLGEKLKAIYEARLAYVFPDKPCIVDFYIPENKDDLEDYQLTFWQKKHDI